MDKRLENRLKDARKAYKKDALTCDFILKNKIDAPVDVSSEGILFPSFSISELVLAWREHRKKFPVPVDFLFSEHFPHCSRPITRRSFLARLLAYKEEYGADRYNTILDGNSSFIDGLILSCGHDACKNDPMVIPSPWDAVASLVLTEYSSFVNTQYAKNLVLLIIDGQPAINRAVLWDNQLQFTNRWYFSDVFRRAFYLAYFHKRYTSTKKIELYPGSLCSVITALISSNYMSAVPYGETDSLRYLKDELLFPIGKGKVSTSVAIDAIARAINLTAGA